MISNIINQKMDLISNSYLPWTSEDDERVKQLYNEEKLDCMEIGVLFKRTPGSIAARLVKIDVIKNRFDAKGYDEYKKSELYKKVCEINREKKSSVPKNEKIKIIDTSDDLKRDIMDLKGDLHDLKGEMRCLKNDVRDLKNSIRIFGKQMEKMFGIIESIYEFEK